MGTNVPELTVGPPPSSIVLPPSSVIGGFWKRLLAFLVDSLLLGIVGTIIGAVFFNTLVAMGPWVRLVGFCIALCYFGSFDSSEGNGRTIGKRILRLKVVNAQGGMLSPAQAVLRFVVFGVPFFLNGLSLPISRTPWVVSTFINIVVLGGGATNLYLLIFNRPMRQGLHDLSVRSYVVTTESEGSIVAELFWKTHWAIIAALVVSLGVGESLIGPRLLNKVRISQLMADATMVERIDGVQSAEITSMSSFGNNASGKFLSINIHCTGEPGDEERVADQVAKLILQNDHNIQNYLRLRIAIIRGYDLGISSRWASRTFNYSPDEWRARIQ
jgi:uncharacterized RDD family membrane protein YckC